MTALDFGCGKFRYTIPLSRQVKCVYAVDSRHQIHRFQRVRDKQTSLMDYASTNLPNVKVTGTDLMTWKRRRYDFILCANVLSVMPTRELRIATLATLRRCLKKAGLLLVCTQFRNAHFKSWASNPQATWCKGGWLVCGRRGASFYAILPLSDLIKLCTAARLIAFRSGTKGETAFVFASRTVQTNAKFSAALKVLG